MTQTIENKDFTITFLVDQTPREVFHAITNVRGWWSEDIEGATSQLNDEFVYHYKDIHSCKTPGVKGMFSLGWHPFQRPLVKSCETRLRIPVNPCLWPCADQAVRYPGWHCPRHAQ